jgi:hypothetical protein
MDGWMNEWMDGLTVGWMDGKMNVCMNRLMDGWMDILDCLIQSALYKLYIKSLRPLMFSE